MSRKGIRSHVTNSAKFFGDEERKRSSGSQRDTRKKQWIRWINNTSVMMPTIIETLTDRRGFAMEALLDCGGMGCYINDGFANAKNLLMDHLPQPVPVYNTNGTHKKGGCITHTVTLWL